MCTLTLLSSLIGAAVCYKEQWRKMYSSGCNVCKFAFLYGPNVHLLQTVSFVLFILCLKACGRNNRYKLVLLVMLIRIDRYILSTKIR
jgi:hypothetical protein